jgi:hypothetical protein
MRSMRTTLESPKVKRIVAPPPAIKGLPADVETATGKSGIPVVRAIKVEPSQPNDAVPA